MILDKFSLIGKVAIVTGASRGLGEGMALGLAEAGADVVVIASSKKINDVAAKIKTMGRKVLAIQADLGSIDPIPDIITKTLDEFGTIDILLNCVGGFGINRCFAYRVVSLLYRKFGRRHNFCVFYNGRF